jgi:glyoxylase-like metal-dependent hydrolase (beta-lactamase superfamily II)
MDIRVISIGTLAANPLWGEKAAVRVGHATTSLVRSDKRVILIDPGLPEPTVVGRLFERAGIRPEAVTHVFLTSFRPETRRGILAFEHATWWISPAEREGVGVPLIGRLQEAVEHGDQELRAALELDVAILKRFEPAPDRLAAHVDLFPLPGVTPGLSGVLIAQPRATTLICGDAIATLEHLEKGMVLGGAAGVEQAQGSFAEAVEIADWLVLGRDSMVANPVRRGF